MITSAIMPRARLGTKAMNDAAYERYVKINLPHARTVAMRVGRNLEAIGALGEPGADGIETLHQALDALERALAGFDEDPPMEAAVVAADVVAKRARAVVEAILETPARNDRLGQHVRNLFECLGLAEEGRTLSLLCGERHDSVLR
jgi:hypothetical protein